jgi:hypothetical protein
MEEYIKTISNTTKEQIIDYLNTNIEPLLTERPYGAAKGRMQIWLNYEPELAQNPDFYPAHIDQRIWSYIQKLAPAWFEPHVALITKGGPIGRHRDASYADYPAMSINLGSVTWHYENCRPNYSHKSTCDSAPPMSANLTGGEVFMFNCKNPHWVTDVDPQRWSINVWTISPKYITKFNSL